MKNQYFGDQKDYLTYGLLRTLARAANLRLGVVWMLTPDVSNNEGELRDYLKRTERWKAFDSELYAHLQQVPRHGRRVELAAELNLLPGAAYFPEPLPPSKAERAAYFERLWPAVAGCELLFFDPDNGMEVPSAAHPARRSSKHVYWDELGAAYQRGHSLLIFQHFPRRTRAAYLPERAAQLARHLDGATLSWFEASQVAFFLAARPEHAAALAGAPAAVQAQWSPHIRPGLPPAPPAAAPTAQPGLHLSLLPGHLAVCRLERGAPLPAWAGGALTAITRTPDELSVVCDEAGVPDGVQMEGGWRALKVAGPLDFSLTGILAVLAGPLAAAGVSIFAISTYDTDYVLVKAASLASAAAVLRAAGHRLDPA